MVVSGAPVTQLAEAARSKLGARSGWVSSTPVSMTATVTRFEPSDFWCALSALIAGSAHCSGSSGSSPAVACAAAAAAWASVSGCAMAPTSLVACGTIGLVRVAPADSTPRTRRIVSPKAGFCEWATTTPICS